MDAELKVFVVVVAVDDVWFRKIRSKNWLML